MTELQPQPLCQMMVLLKKKYSSKILQKLSCLSLQDVQECACPIQHDLPSSSNESTTNIKYGNIDFQFQLISNLGAKIVNTNNLLLGVKPSIA